MCFFFDKSVRDNVMLSKTENSIKHCSALLLTVLSAHKKSFVIYTCGQDSSSYIKTAEELIKSKDASFAGFYSCPGYDTWGPFKLIGGKNKNHPDENDIEKTIQFYENLI